MASESLTNDVAWATATHIVEIFSPMLRGEEQKEAFVEVYARVKAGLECFQVMQQDSMQRRMQPGVN